jgi:5-methylcytosine-specific restriction endonuclease McrA
MGGRILFPKVEHKRIGFTPKQRADAMAKTGGMCAKEGCNKPAEEINHIDPVAMGGAHELNNWEPLCSVHHKIETAWQVKMIRKADRMAGRRGSQSGRRKKNGPQLKSAKKPWPKRSFPSKKKSTLQPT